MNNRFQQQFLKLVQDTRKFIEQQSPLMTTRPPHAPVEAPSVQIPVDTVALPVKKAPRATQNKSAWELQPMSLALGNTPLLNKLSALVQTCEPVIPIFLVLPEENAPHRLFLENVSRAITRTFAPASVILYEEKILSTHSGRIFLAPVTLLQSKFPQAQPHQIIKTGIDTLLPLEPLDLYAEETNCKRALWNAIQLLFRS